MFRHRPWQNAGDDFVYASTGGSRPLHSFLGTNDRRPPPSVIANQDNGSTGIMNGNGGMSSMLPLMMMGGNMGDMFDGMFDFDMSSNDDDDTEVDEEEEA